MTDDQTPPETPPEETPPEETLGDLDPERSADDVAEDRLTGYAVYDNVEGHYLNGVERGRGAKARAEKRSGDDDRYSVRRV